MDAIVSFFTGIGDAIISTFNFIISFFADIVYVIQLLGRTIGSVRGYFSWLPGSITGLLFTLFAIVIIYKILGREG